MNKQEVINELLELQRRTSQLILNYALKSWRELELPLAQLKSLFVIAGKGETNLRTLAHELDVTPGNVTGIVERLVKQGLISRKPNPEDRRQIRLKATKKGQDLLSSLMENQTTHMVNILEYMSLEEMESLLKGLSGFVLALEEHQKELSV
jgi:DNA-binding MarR family transcriptional regulator